jgi:predicted glycoside hydrolase/deacetylase ChbG (UPF0249 family)
MNSGLRRELRQELLQHDLLLEAAGAELLAQVDRAHAALGQELEHDVALDRLAASLGHGRPTVSAL